MAENTYEKKDNSGVKTGGSPKIKWYRKKSVRILAGILAFLLVVTTIGYAIIRARAESLYAQMAKSDELLREKSQENPVDIGAETLAGTYQDYEELASAVEKEDYKGAIDKTKKLMEKEEDVAIKAELQELLAKLYYNTDQFQESVDAVNARLEMPGTPSSALYYVNGLNYIQLQDYKTADDNLSKAKELGYEDTDVLNLQLAIAAYSDKNYEKAAASAEDYLKGNATDDVNLCRYIAALSELGLGGYKESVKYLDEILAEEEDKELYYYRGIANMALENYGEAVEDFTQCKEMGKDDTDVYYDLGICQISIGEIEPGVENLKKVIQKNDRQELTTAASNVLTAVAGEY